MGSRAEAGAPVCHGSPLPFEFISGAFSWRGDDEAPTLEIYLPFSSSHRQPSGSYEQGTKGGDRKRVNRKSIISP